MEERALHDALCALLTFLAKVVAASHLKQIKANQDRLLQVFRICSSQIQLAHMLIHLQAGAATTVIKLRTQVLSALLPRLADGVFTRFGVSSVEQLLQIVAELVQTEQFDISTEKPSERAKPAAKKEVPFVVDAALRQRLVSVRNMNVLCSVF